MFLTEILDPIVEKFNQLGDVTNILTICVRILAAIICGGILGLERERKKHAAGFRTYILVCLGSAVVMMLNDFLTIKSGSDAARLGAQVISGIGFLGAGTILITSKNRIKGLTTAAGLWTSACTGLAIGAGFYTLAFIASLSILIILSTMPLLEILFQKKSAFYEIQVELYEKIKLKDLIDFLRSNNVKILSIEKNPAYHDSGLSVYTLLFVAKGKKKLKRNDFISDIQNLDYVNYCEEIN